MIVLKLLRAQRLEQVPGDKGAHLEVGEEK